MPALFRCVYLAPALLMLSAQALAAGPGTLRFWNTTAETINELYLSPVGASRWSANLCLSDPDHGVDPDERLSLPGVTPGRYDVRVVDAKHRSCVFHNVQLSGSGRYAFLLSESQMTECHQD